MSKRENKKNGQGERVDPEKLKQAEELWLEGYSYSEIAARTGLLEPTIKYHARTKKDCWRNRIFSDPLFVKGIQEQGKSLRETSGMLVKLIRREVTRRIQDSETPLTLVETKLASDIYANLDRVYRLEEKMPTDILERRDMSPKEVKEGIFEILNRLDEKDPLGEFNEESLRKESSDSKIVQ